MSTPSFESILGKDLHGLAREQGAELVGVQELASARRARDAGMAYRLDFDDGSSLKGRRLFSAAHARRVEYWIGALEHPMLPQVRGRRGAALLLDWVVGEPPPRASRFDPDLHPACAEFQARLHLRCDRGIESGSPRFSIEDLAARLRNGGTTLEAHELLDASEAAALLRIAENSVPRRIAPVLVHDDLCGENLVIDTRGRVRIVDNEGLQVGYAAHDIARTVYRWEMDDDTEERYLAHYEEICSAEAFRAEREFWMAVVLVESACHRASASPGQREIPLARLRRELRDQARGGRVG